MTWLRPTFPPTLGITATLALLWLVAAAQAGPDSATAAALDPGRAGSIGDWWGDLQLTVALLAAVAMPEFRVLALAPAALLAGEVGEVHIHAATMLAAATGADQHLAELKATAGIVLGLAALGATVRIRHLSCWLGMLVALVLGGAASVLVDAGQVLGFGGPWWSASEEWCELAVYSVVTAMILSVAIKSRYRTFAQRPAARGRRLGG